MTRPLDTLAPGDSELHPPGPEEVSLLRHADPVYVRPSGSLSGFPMAFYEKKIRMTAGGQVIVAPGGRAEILWPGGSSIVLFGRGTGWIGSPSRGDPMFDFQDLERARLQLGEGDQVRLVGGALLTGSSGPYLLEHRFDDTLWIHNQSKAQLLIAFRDETIELGPGQGVRLPLLSAGGAPFSDDPGWRRITGPTFSVQVRGEVESLDDPVGVRLGTPDTVVGDLEARALGIRVRLGLGEEVTFTGLEPPQAAPPKPTSVGALTPQEPIGSAPRSVGT